MVLQEFANIYVNCYTLRMPNNVKEFVDFWIANSVHARLDMGQVGSSQSVEDLTQRLVQAAEQQGLSSAEIIAEIGDPIGYIRDKLSELNLAESERRNEQAR